MEISLRLLEEKKLGTGDCTLAEELVLEHREAAQRVAKGMLKKWRAYLSADELCSTIDLALCVAARGYRPGEGSSFMTYLHFYIKGYLIQAISKRANDKLVASEDDFLYAQAETQGDEASGGAFPTSNQDSCPHRSIYRKQLRSILKRGCSSLSESELEVVEGIFFQDKTVSQLAKEIGYSRGHVSRIKTKAIQKLHTCLLPALSSAEHSAHDAVYALAA